MNQPNNFREMIYQEEQQLHERTKHALFSQGNNHTSGLDKTTDEFRGHKKALVDALKQNSQIFQSAPKENELRKEIYALIARGELTIPKRYEQAIVEDYITEVHGFSLIDDLMKDSDVSDIQIIGSEAILYTKNGLVYNYGKTFSSNDELMDFINTKLEKTKSGFDRSKGSVDAYLHDGSRVHVKGEVSGYTVYDEQNKRFNIKYCNIVSIRKFVRDWTLDELMDTGMLNERMVEYIRLAFQLEYSCVVSGSVGSGKTSLINAMFELLNPVFTACVIEDSPEMQPHHPRCVRMWEKRGNNEEKGSISTEQNVIDTLRMNFKYTVIGETRTPNVAFEFIKSIDLGNSVCITSTHASDAYGAVMRMLFLATSSSTRPSEEMVRNQLRRLKLLIHARKLPDGRRKVTRISELTGFTDKGEPILHDVFAFSIREDDFTFNGITENFKAMADELGVEIPDWMLNKGEEANDIPHLS